MTVERMFELITDCLVFICFSCLGLVSVLVFPARLLFVPVQCGKAERPRETRHGCAVFFDRLRPCCKNPSIVLEFVASSILYDDASIHATRGDPAARRLLSGPDCSTLVSLIKSEFSPLGKFIAD
jgi:hypothetical protein